MIEKSILNCEDFLECFEGDGVMPFEFNINRKNVDFGIIKLKSNNYDMARFTKYLKEVSVTYALPSQRVEQLKKENSFMTICDETKEKFINSGKSKNGEGGELILYSMLENHLGAPKLLSKMKLKTDKEMPIHGSDGIHILQRTDKEFELIFCESKMYKDLTQGLNNAFDSIEKFIENEADINFENTVLSTNLSGEFPDDIVNELCNYILPSKNNFRTNNALSIFVGFEFPTDNIDKSLDYDEYRRLISKKINKYIDSRKSKLEKFFKKHANYSFYVYLIPFENIDNARKKIIEEVEGRTFDE